MSELQIGLLIIGVVVVLLVYGYGAWQQRQYRRRFGVAFTPGHGDGLYSSVKVGAGEALADPLGVEDAAEEETAEDLCDTLDAACDYIAEMPLDRPMQASMLWPLWQRRFDFGKSVNVCGLNAEHGAWEKVVAESQSAFTYFRLALQLVDRNGAASEAHLASFRDLVRDIAAENGIQSTLPDVSEAAQRAASLDAFCAEVDHMIGLNILPDGDRLLSGRDVAEIAAKHGLTLQTDGTFQLLDVHGHTLFSLANLDDDPFQHHTLDQTMVMGLSLQLDVPRVSQPTKRFDEMMDLAWEIGRELNASVVDDYRAALTDAAIGMIRNQVATLEKQMVSYPVIPGSAQARRLFS